MGSVLTKDWSAVTQWAVKAIGLPNVGVQVRLRGNHLHVLCEASQCPSEKIAASQFSFALQQTNLESLLPPGTPQIYKVFLCGRQQGARRPEWTVKLECNNSLLLEETPPHSPSSDATIEGTHRSAFEKLTGLFSHHSQPHQAQPNSSPPPPFKSDQTPTQAKSDTPSITISAPQETHNSPKTPSSGLKVEPSQPPLIDSNSTVGAKQSPSQPSTPVQSEKLPSSPTEPHRTPPAKNIAVLHTAPTDTQTPSDDPAPSLTAPLTVSTESLARQGHLGAIASYLSEILGSLGVTVKVKIRDRSTSRRKSRKLEEQPATQTTSQQRLWVLCESGYSPDPSLLADPIAQRLRELNLENFRDACILLQVQGEPKPDWMLRVDLTPPNKTLTEWARWGDEDALADLLHQKLTPLQVDVRATLKESTLHLFCHRVTSDEAIQPTKSSPRKKAKPKAPPQQKVMAAIAPILETLAPQGIHAATVYGLSTPASERKPESPAWIDWLNLPAAQNPALQPPTLTVAQQGNLEVLTFIITRLVNPDLNTTLATGGIRVLLLRKGSLLHVMSEAPTCPSQFKVASPVAKFLRSHPIDGIAGVRIYGRRAGQKHPLWRYGVALQSQKSAQRETSDFAPSEPEPDDLVAQTGQLVFNPDVLGDLGQGSVPVAQVQPNWANTLEEISRTLQQGLMASGLFVAGDGGLVPVENRAAIPYRQMGLALVWGAVGLLLTLQADRLLGQWGREYLQFSSSEQEVEFRDDSSQAGQMVSTSTSDAGANSTSDNEEVFNSSNFVSSSSRASRRPISQRSYPSFNSEQLDEQLARYQYYVKTEKQPPDVLILGSSRALRGVDPDALTQALIEQGYPKLKVFNFGVNGATAQVVELILSQILPAQQLPQLVIVADGVRALNSGRVDRTYDTIAQSQGYQQLAQGNFRISAPQLNSPGTDFQQGLRVLRNFSQNRLSLDQMQQWFNQKLVSVSAAYPHRDHLKQGLQAMVNRKPFLHTEQTLPDVPEATENGTPEIPELKYNGFLPLSVRFDPQTYYQNHSKVSGYYDSDYQAFELDGMQTIALKNLLQYVQSHQVGVVFVNMPLTQDYLDPVRTAYEEKFRQHMQQMAAETELIFIDLALEWLNTSEYFSDPSHLNRYGAAAVSQQLAQETMIPWPER